MYGFGMVHDGIGLMNVVSSYCGDLIVAATADRAIMPDPGSYADALMSSFDDLAAATT